MGVGSGGEGKTRKYHFRSMTETEVKVGSSMKKHSLEVRRYKGHDLVTKVLVEEDGAITLGCAAEEEVVHVEVLQHFLGVEQDAQDFENLVCRHHQVVIADI